VAAAKVSLSELRSDGAALYWLESRPAEAGRVVLVRAGDEGLSDHSPPEVSIRSRVHEYGGGAVCLVPRRASGAFAYVDQADQRVWFCDGPAGPGGAGGADPVPLGAEPPDGELHRHGGLGTTSDGNWVLAVREVHGEGAARPSRRVVALSTRPELARESVLAEGHDFFGAPSVDRDGERLAVVVWDHPDMPWDASTLVVVPLTRTTGGDLVTAGPPWTVAGGPAESVGQPAWAADGSLRFVSDRNGWWQPWSHAGHAGAEAVVMVPPDLAGEWHGPDWVLGQGTMGELDDGTVVARVTRSGRDALVPLRPGRDLPEPLPLPCVSVSAVCAHGDGVALIGATPESAPDVWVWTPTAAARVRRPLTEIALGTPDVAHGEPFTLTGRSGRPVHGALYRPARDGYAAPAGERPPLVVWCHGGPTSACPAGLDLTLQFFTTRGLAVACVDYAGSSGYGRAYRCSLWGRWGVADAEDCLDAALHLAARGDVDPGRLAVRGGSAGGMTALNALAAGEGFAACTSWYGVTDLLALVATMHDFEAHYTDRLIGPLPEARRLYEERSPVRRAGAMRGAVLLLQGTEDAVVPPAQAEGMRDALVAAGVPCDLRFFEGEGHGFRRADTLTACLEAEIAFYRERLGL
ncbi:MAG TPA: prolyl oligopeptidase family serine peptidase, partial [Acidimicrobiales bacterium]|nr:prolyl oligopeptidase family serine peptidase [Acidimicrobiales bacterium]